MRIKCPNCGSTAQVELVWQDTDNYGTAHAYEYECGCGCTFEVTFKVTEVKVLEMKKKEEEKIKYRGHIHCPANGYDCPYWKDGLCGLWSEEEGYSDPLIECDDFGAFWDEGDDYIDYGED